MKIPFPWLPFLKFDFTGVPVVFAPLLYGFDSGVTASLVACLAILVRSGDLVGAVMNALAEVSIIAGLYAGLRWLRSCRVLCSDAMGLLARIAVMSLFNLVVLPMYHGMPFQVAVGLVPMLGVSTPYRKLSQRAWVSSSTGPTGAECKRARMRITQRKGAEEGVAWVEIEDFMQDLEELDDDIAKRFKKLMIRIKNEGITFNLLLMYVCSSNLVHT